MSGYDARALLMTTHLCEQCGHTLSESSEFCGQCGALTPPPGQPEQPPQAAPMAGARTLLQVAPSPNGAEKANAPRDAEPVAPRLVANKTMIGIPLPGFVTPPKSEPPPARTPEPIGRSHLNKTMLGVATPGIAPFHESAGSTAATRLPSPEKKLAPAATRRGALGHTLPIAVEYVPPPAPLPEMPAPVAPRIVRPHGLPLARVALTAGVVVLVGGVLMAVLWRGAPPITVQPRVAPDGKDTLHLVCDAKSCKDGTVVAYDETRATFAGGEADLPLVTPLRVGDNALALSIDRPGMGRDETVNVVVPVAYRVRADVSTMETPRPSITIRIQALPGAEVHIDGRPILLDHAGSGGYSVDETAATEGAADESRVVSVDVPYVVSLKGRAPEKGIVSARVAVAPLRVDAPGTTAVMTENQVLLAGRAARGAHVTIDGAPAAVGPEGAFETKIALDAMGQRTVEVRAGTATLVPRTVHVVISRVATLAEAAQAFEELSPIGYDTAMSTLTSKIGLPIAVEGDVVESRASGHRTVVLVDDRRGCAKGPCYARVLVGRELSLVHGDWLRAYGHLARAFTTAAGQALPEVEAEFVLGAKR